MRRRSMAVALVSLVFWAQLGFAATVPFSAQSGLVSADRWMEIDL